MNKYMALEAIWGANVIITAEDSMGIKYKFAKINDQFRHTRLELDEWFNNITVTDFLTNFKNFTYNSQA